MICAICTDDITGAYAREPLGRNDALVNVCPDCATSPIVARRGPDYPYEPTGLPTRAELAHINGRPERPWVVPQRAKDGMRVIRLPICRNGVTRSAGEAVAADLPTLAGKLRYLGVVNTLHGGRRPHNAQANGSHIFETSVSDVEVRRHKARAIRLGRIERKHCINHDNRAATHGVRCGECQETHQRSARA